MRENDAAGGPVGMKMEGEMPMFKETRRDFLRKMAAAGLMLTLSRKTEASALTSDKETQKASCALFRAVNGHPAENMNKVLELMGGIERLIGPDEVVLIKPNVQWWNQGAPNLAALNAFVDAIMNRPGGFRGEVVVAENCHRGPEPWASDNSGWLQRFLWNSDLEGIYNMNGLCALLKKRYGSRFSTCHWLDVDGGGRRVFGPEDGNGYVYCDGSGGVPLLSVDNGVRGEGRRAAIMNYPIFQTDQGTTIDLMHGIWEKGSYTGAPFFFVNFSALNHHSTYCGGTSAIKNYLGVTDLSGGPDPYHNGKMTEDSYNFHSFPFDKWASGPAPGMLGAEIAAFMKTIRKADLNVTTAEWVGLASRTVPPMARTRAVLASKDPVALDYHAFKYVLYPNSGTKVHDPDDVNSPVYQDLSTCAEQGGGVVDERRVKTISYDEAKRGLQGADELRVIAEKDWGSNPKTIMKHLWLRYSG